MKLGAPSVPYGSARIHRAPQAVRLQRLRQCPADPGIDQGRQHPPGGGHAERSSTWRGWIGAVLLTAVGGSGGRQHCTLIPFCLIFPAAFLLRL